MTQSAGEEPIGQSQGKVVLFVCTLDIRLLFVLSNIFIRVASSIAFVRNALFRVTD